MATETFPLVLDLTLGFLCEKVSSVCWEVGRSGKVRLLFVVSCQFWRHYCWRFILLMMMLRYSWQGIVVLTAAIDVRLLQPTRTRLQMRKGEKGEQTRTDKNWQKIKSRSRDAPHSVNSDMTVTGARGLVIALGTRPPVFH